MVAARLRGMTSTSPREPRADLRAAAIHLHELFVALTNEGFTEGQALTILGQVLAANQKNG